MTSSLLDGHGLFQRRYFHEREYIRGLAHADQRPRALFIGCSDSRVVPEYLTSAGFGELFVLRNIANFVPALEHTDASVGAAIDYALGSLEVPDIIVCGHYGCGGVKAALDDLGPLRERHPSLHEWLEGVAPAARRGLAAGDDPDAVWRRGVEENVIQALENLITYDVVREKLEAGTVHLHAWIYDLYQTRIRVLDVEREGFVDASEIQRDG
ncbi:MAG: carbonic anhydrase [Myxococcaceae bacterium]|nr:carbonic anhydrase [Myxococcaceae bacterium]